MHRCLADGSSDFSRSTAGVSARPLDREPTAPGRTTPAGRGDLIEVPGNERLGVPCRRYGITKRRESGHRTPPGCGPGGGREGHGHRLTAGNQSTDTSSSVKGGHLKSPKWGQRSSALAPGRTPLVRIDNGFIFQSRRSRRACRQYRLRQEFITPYTPEQNGTVDPFFRSLKEECTWLHNFRSLRHVARAARQWIAWNNKQRPHQALANLSPAQYRSQQVPVLA